MSDIRDEQLSESIQHKEAMEELEATPGWKLIVANLNAQIDERTKKLEEPLGEGGQVYLHEYMKGARQMARFILTLPKVITDSATEVVDAITKEQEETEDGGDTDESGDSSEGNDGDNGDD